MNEQLKLNGSSDGLRRFPAVRCYMGDWIYYVTTMPMREVAKRVKRTSEIYDPKGFDDRVQRALRGRVRDITSYLVNDPQRFFNSIVVGVLGKAPTWYPLDIKPHPYDEIPALDERYRDSMGILELSTDEQLFAVDGQHRVEAIKEALKKNPDLEEEDVTLLFVGAGLEGVRLRRVRHLFSTLNKTAVRLSKAERIALDESHPAAIVVRKMIREYRGFGNPERVDFGMADIIHYGYQTEIPKANQKSFTSIVAVSSVVETLGRAELRRWNSSKMMSADSDDAAERIWSSAIDFFDSLVEEFDEVRKAFEAGTDYARVVKQNRHSDGGHVLFRPVGLISVARVAEFLKINHGIPYRRSLGEIAKTEMDLTRRPWPGVMFNPAAGRAIAQNQTLDVALMLYMVGAEHPTIKDDELLKRYQNVIDDREATLSGIPTVNVFNQQ